MIDDGHPVELGEMPDPFELVGELRDIAAKLVGGDWTFHVVGQVVPWQRTGGQGKRRFTPKRTRDYQDIVATLGAIRRPARWPYQSKDARFALTLYLFMGDLRTRDLDNCEKTIKDALNGVAWRDDSQIDEAHKYRRLDRDNPRVEITITVL